MSMESSRGTGILKAGADLSSYQDRFAKVSGVGAVTVSTAKTDSVVGVIRNTPVAGEGVDLADEGIMRIVAGEAITAGGQIMSGTGGKAYAAATGDTSYVLGIALETSTDDGQVISFLKGFNHV